VSTVLGEGGEISGTVVTTGKMPLSDTPVTVTVASPATNIDATLTS
jgi:hypothetical protein